jgi:hypothetical protein
MDLTWLFAGTANRFTLLTKLTRCERPPKTLKAIIQDATGIGDLFAASAENPDTSTE